MILLLALFYDVCLVAFAITILGGRQTAENGGFALLAQLIEHLCGKETQTGTRGIDRCGAVLTDDAGPISAAFPRRTHRLLTNVVGRSCAAPLTAPAR